MVILLLWLNWIESKKVLKPRSTWVKLYPIQSRGLDYFYRDSRIIRAASIEAYDPQMNVDADKDEYPHGLINLQKANVVPYQL